MTLNKVLILIAVIIFSVVAIIDRNLLAAGLSVFAAGHLV